MSEHALGETAEASRTSRRAMELGRGLASGAVIEVTGYGLTQLIRFGTNLVLTRLLFPEAFGLMAMMGVVLYGLTMLSDVGIAQAVIRSRRGDDPPFLHTAWTLLVMRGLGLWAVAAACAWPMSAFFQQPALLWILPIGAVGSILHAFGSTRMFLMRRQVRPGPLVALELASQVAGTATIIAGAYAGLGVAGLVIGHIVTAAVHTGGSFLLPGTHRDRFGIEPEARRQIFDFGRWIFAASAVTFLANRGDQFVLGRLLGAAGLGLYNIAFALAELPEAVAQRLMAGVLYPAFARGHLKDPGEMPRIYFRTRLVFDGVLHTALGGLAGMAPWLIDLLYDERYHGAKEMLQVLAVRTALGLMAQPCESYLTALGLSHYGFRRQLFVAGSVLLFMPVGHALGGSIGLLWASALSRVMGLVAIWPAAREQGILRFERELLVVVFLALGYGLGTVMVWMLPGM
ncbi:MAG: oligosaccharide flippase family protein [Myxococcaceae bacterium]|nr:oligosaccharide flippase family protein [Myxococcaceae bacterium]